MTDTTDTEDMPDFDDEPATAAAPPELETHAPEPAAPKGKVKTTSATKADTPAPVPGQVLKPGKAPPKLVDRSGDAHALVRITKTGHGHVHDGNDGFYDWGTELVLENSVALALEGRSYAEIIG